MKKNNSMTFIIVGGIVILTVFVTVLVMNLLPDNNESNSYYVKVNDEMSAKIESLNLDNNKLIIETSGDAEMYCVKSTRSKPENSALCWNKIINNRAEISVYSYRKYYVWIKDTNGNISNPMSINTK